MSPYFPVGTTYAEMMQVGRRVNAAATTTRDTFAFGASSGDGAARAGGADPLTFGTGVVASFLARVLAEPGIEILLEHRVNEILRDAEGRVTGVRAATDNGEVTLGGRVVLATSTYDWDAELAEEMTGLTTDDFASIAPESLRGDGIGLVRQIDGAIAKIPATSVPMLPGWKDANGKVG